MQLAEPEKSLRDWAWKFSVSHHTISSYNKQVQEGQGFQRTYKKNSLSTTSLFAQEKLMAVADSMKNSWKYRTVSKFQAELWRVYKFRISRTGGWENKRKLPLLLKKKQEGRRSSDSLSCSSNP